MEFDIPSGWDASTIGDQVTLQRGLDITKKEQRPGDVPVVSSGGVSSYHDEAAVDGPGVVMGRKGTLGRVYYIDEPYWPHDTTLWVRDFKGNDPRYVYYFFVGLDVMHLDVGSANPTLNRNHVHPLPVAWPPLDEQRRIAAVLGALDDRIVVNRGMNRTLEAMAQALFRRRFVDFDGRDDLVEHEAGPIPEGWRWEPLDQVADFLNGTACQKHPAVDGAPSLPVIKIREMRAGITDNTDRASLDVPEKFVVEDRDMLFSWSGSLLAEIWTGGQGLLNQHIFKVTSEGFPRWFYYLWVREHLDRFQRIAADKATTMGHIKRRHLTEALAAVPTPGEVETMSAVLGPLVERQVENNLQSRTLAALRDALLPKLVSGELRVPEAEEAVEAAL